MTPMHIQSPRSIHQHNSRTPPVHAVCNLRIVYIHYIRASHRVTATYPHNACRDNTPLVCLFPALETSMRGPLRHLWVAGGPQRQLLETIDVAATGFVLQIRSGPTMRSIVFLETPNCCAIACFVCSVPKGLDDSGLLRRQLSFAATESPPGSRRRQSTLCVR
jgi:hypothetical protein